METIKEQSSNIEGESPEKLALDSSSWAPPRGLLALSEQAPVPGMLSPSEQALAS